MIVLPQVPRKKKWTFKEPAIHFS